LALWDEPEVGRALKDFALVLLGGVIAIVASWLQHRWTSKSANEGDRRREQVSALGSLYSSLVQAHYLLGLISERAVTRWWFQAPLVSRAIIEVSRVLAAASGAYIRLSLVADRTVLDAARQALTVSAMRATFDERAEQMDESLQRLRDAALTQLGVELPEPTPEPPA
jgi:hypothetical protein